MSSFRVFVWDPVLLVSQIVCMQTVFYSVECACLLFFSCLSSYDPQLTTIFSLHVTRGMIVAQLVASVSCAVALSLVVQRAKQALDFSCTAHAIHCIFSFIYSRGIALQPTWWILQVVSTTVCTILGEYLCMRVESQDILLGAPASKYDL